MKKDPAIFLKHILESIDHIESYINGLEEKDFMESDEKQDSVIRRLEILGEAVRNLPEEFRKKHSGIEWNSAMATRNILIHNYFGIELDIVWDTVTQSMPVFKRQIEALLDKESEYAN